MDSEIRENSEEPPRTPSKPTETESPLEQSDIELEIDLTATVAPRNTYSPIPLPTSEIRENSQEHPRTPSKSTESESPLEQSDTELKIDLTATLASRNTCSTIVSPTSQQELDIIETIEDEIGKQLNEKADKSNLTVTNVKSIIKQVLTNEHVRALLAKGDMEEGGKAQIVPYEPKLTRSKAKELLSSTTIAIPSVNIPWVPQPPPSETHVLIGEDLREDDSGDEYIPGEEESEEDKEESNASESDANSLPPPTPPIPVSMEDQATQTTTNYTDDGVFKIPPPKTTQDGTAEEAANIALRTRSKINLSSTPLEVIEKSFVPPDITTDMYDMDCDDDEWREFLKGFTEPLEEVTKPTEDEEQDPEYNIMADDKINKVDKEDFRADKAVKITKKEVKELWEELFEYLHDVSEEYGDQNKNQTTTVNNEFFDSSAHNVAHVQGLDATNHAPCEEGSNSLERSEKDTTNMLDISIEHQQLCIIEQQMRQHVQMLTQNFFLVYEHPEFNDYSAMLREYLLNLKFLSEGKTYSLFRPVNLLPAIELVDDWIKLCATNCEEIKHTKGHIQQDLLKSIQYKMAGNYGFIVTFPKLMLEIISKSDVFLFPSLLPKIPFKSEQFSKYSRCGFTDGEDSLLVFGMDQFKQFLTQENELKGSKKTVSLRETVSQVQEYMMPHRNSSIVLKHIFQSKHPRCATNPIQQYLLHGKLKPMVHYLYPLNHIVPPCKRRPDELPYQWKNFIYPKLEENNITQTQNINILPLQGIVPQQLILINSPSPGGPLFASPVTPIIFAQPKKSSSKARTSLQKKFNSIATGGKSSNNVKGKGTSNATRRSSKSKRTLDSSFTSIELLISIFLRPVAVQKLVQFLTKIDEEGQRRPVISERVFVKVHQSKAPGMFSNMPGLNTPIKCDDQPEEPGEVCTVTSTTVESAASSSETPIEGPASSELVKSEPVTSCATGPETKREQVGKNLEFSTITSSSFQKANTSTEVEFCRNSSNIQICQTSQCDENDAAPSSSGYNSGTTSGKDNPEDINALFIASSTVKSNVRKESAAEKKKNKLRKEFMANLSIATPEDPESEKHKNEMFAVAYYDKLRESLELEDYNKIMQLLNDFGCGDVIDLYEDVQGILRPKYSELADEFLFFLKEKEAHAIGQLIPWLEIQARTKFLRKLEIFLKDQPTQLKRIYNTLMDLSKAENLTMKKIKGMLVPLLKGNAILLDLFLQNFHDERPPPSLLEGPYETIDLSKELARPDNGEQYETFVVPNTEDKYGGQNCICHCHRIEDNEYKSRSKHCNACGLKFANGKLYLSAGRVFQPATVTFKTSPRENHTARLLGKSAPATSSRHKRKRAEISPNKLASSSGKENLEEDTEDEELGKRRRSSSQKTPRKRKKTEKLKLQESCKPITPKKSPGKSGETWDVQKDSIKPRKRTYSAKRTKKKEAKKTDEKVEDLEGPITEKIADEEREVITEVEECEVITEGEECEVKTEGEEGEVKTEEEECERIAEAEECEVITEMEESEHETSEEHPEKSAGEDCMDSSGESLEKPLTPGQQTAESESETCLEEESSQDNYASDDSSSSTESTKGSQSDSNTNDEPPWRREEDTVILETLQKEDDKEYALQIISDKLPNRTVGQIRSRLSRLMNLLIETLKNT